MQSKPTLETNLAHRSIRKFSQKSVANEVIEQLLNAASMASTSNHLQCVSIIRITDLALREQLKACASNQEYVLEAPEFWVFCIDFAKHQQICPEAQLDWAEILMIGSVDCGIMAQNVLLAAESLGLGGVYIGALRNEIEKVGTLLNLPKHTIPVVGMCLGYPNQDPPKKPRFSSSMFCFTNQYQPLDLAKLQQFDTLTANYYQQRSGVDRDWSRNVIAALSKPVRPAVLAYLQKQGFVKR